MSAGVDSIDWTRILLFGLWLAVVGALAWRHVIWRDEARALSFAIQGEDWIAMLRGLHGDGHPALWYFLLRAFHQTTGRAEVLPLLAFAVAVAAAWLLVWRSPFPRPLDWAHPRISFFRLRIFGDGAKLWDRHADPVRARDRLSEMARTRRHAGRAPVSAGELQCDRYDFGGRLPDLLVRRDSRKRLALAGHHQWPISP